MAHRGAVFSIVACFVIPLFAKQAPRVYIPGTNFPRAAAVHKASGDILVVATPGNFSVASLSNGSSLRIIDAGTSVSFPVDVAIHGDTAFVVDQGNEAIAAFNRSGTGEWRLWMRWFIKDLVPACDKVGTRYGMPETIAVSPTGDIYVGLAMQKMKRCLFHPFNRCCEKAAESDASIMQLSGLAEGKAAFHEVFNGSSFFTFTYNGSTLPSQFHVRAIHVTDNGDIAVAGYGDMSGYFGHSAWLWEKRTGTVHNLAGKNCCEEGHTGDGHNASMATLNLPWGITSLSKGQSASEVFYISESGNSDVRAVEHHIISTVPGLSMDLTNCRKIHRGRSPDSLLLTMEGLGDNMGYILEFVPDSISIPTILV